jgi:Asp-tRNA(Asn)/Glu-tRNA(Gln) amidotransferase A subunit family amidase
MTAPDRRGLFRAAAALGLGTSAFHRAVAAEAARAPGDPPTVTPEMVGDAEWVAGVALTDDQRKAVAAALTRTARGLAAGRAVELPNGVPPAVQFNPAPGLPPYTGPRGTVKLPPGDATKPADDEELAFLPAAQLARLVRARRVSSVELTKLYLDRLAKYDPALLCVVTRTDDLALRQARQADDELANGVCRGPLHGVPWVAKDLIAVPGTKTTWGAGHFKDQELAAKATVARRLEDAGAVLVAKTTLGALAMGDRWFGGQTKNPWHLKRGSSGSSAGSAAAVAAGLAGFGVGSETLGSIVSPSAECGVTGLRPTFGRVSRYGCMTLSWTMDKVGPLCRSAEDCALVFGALHGADGLDPTAADRPFDWPAPADWKRLRVGYFPGKPGADGRAVLRVLADLGATLVPVALPTSVPTDAIYPILGAEAAAAFDDLTRAGVTDGIGNWGTTFRQGRFVSAVDYLRANRLRTKLMREMATLMESVDLYVDATRADLLVTNLTGHPSVCVPSGFRAGADGVELPNAVAFTGRLYDEGTLLAVAHAYQEATGHHRRRPDMTKVTKDAAGG